MDAILKENEVQVDLEVSYARGKRVFNCPRSQVRGSISFIHSRSLSQSGLLVTLPASTLRSNYRSDFQTIHLDLTVCRPSIGLLYSCSKPCHEAFDSSEWDCTSVLLKESHLPLTEKAMQTDLSYHNWPLCRRDK
jgi:hypothetical protein